MYLMSGSKTLIIQTSTSSMMVRLQMKIDLALVGDIHNNVLDHAHVDQDLMIIEVIIL